MFIKTVSILSPIFVSWIVAMEILLLETFSGLSLHGQEYVNIDNHITQPARNKSTLISCLVLTCIPNIENYFQVQVRRAYIKHRVLDPVSIESNLHTCTVLKSSTHVYHNTKPYSKRSQSLPPGSFQTMI